MLEHSVLKILPLLSISSFNGLLILFLCECSMFYCLIVPISSICLKSLRLICKIELFHLIFIDSFTQVISNKLLTILFLWIILERNNLLGLYLIVCFTYSIRSLLFQSFWFHLLTFLLSSLLYQLALLKSYISFFIFHIVPTSFWSD